jgi:uncharacterized membrane protein YgaE (UPF0421/DUF939 family)
VAEWSGIRSRGDQLLARVRSLGVRETLSIEREVFRRILKSTLAATLAWLVAELINSPRPALAALAAIIVLQITVRASLARSIQFTVAVTLGLGGAVALGHLLGVSWWSIGVVVLAGLIVGEVLRLGPLSGQVAISALLALSLGNGYGIERTIDTAIGALIGVLVNVLISPASYVSEGGRTLRAIGEDLGALLDDMGTGLTKQPSEETVRRWLSRARDLSADSRAAIATVKQGEESLQFNPRARGELAQLARLTEARRALDHAINQTRGIARSLLDMPMPAPEPEITAALPRLGEMMCAAGKAVAAFGRLQEQPGSAEDRALLEGSPATAARLAARAVHALGSLTIDDADPVSVADGGEARPSAEPSRDAQPSPDAELATKGEAGRLLVSVFVDVERLVHEVDIISGAHRAAVADSEAESDHDAASDSASVSRSDPADPISGKQQQ